MNNFFQQVCPWIVEGKVGQHINITIFDYSAPKLCTSVHEYIQITDGTSVHEYIQITDGNSDTQMFDMCGQEFTHTFISTTHRVEIIFSGHYGIQDEKAFSVFLVKYESKCSINVYCVMHKL